MAPKRKSKAPKKTLHMSGSTKVVARKIRGKHRYCVEVDTGKRAKGFKGKGSTLRFHGCFLDLADAQTRAKKVSR